MTKPSTLARAWPWAAFLFFLSDVGLFFLARPYHRSVFEGELGVVELPTFLLLLPATLIAAWGVLRSEGPERTLFALLALGCFYWAGEEVSWGQTFFHWATPAGWSKGNYQHEMNLHNEKGIVGTLLNQTPRFVLMVVTIVAVALNVPGLGAARRLLARRFPEGWIARLAQCWVPASLALAASALNKFQHVLHYRGFGETLELFTTVMLLQFTALESRSHKRRDALDGNPA